MPRNKRVRFLVFLCVSAATLVTTLAASASTITPGTWMYIQWDAFGVTMQNPVTFTNDGAVVITVTASGCAGDRVSLVDGPYDGTVLGTTSAVPIVFGTCTQWATGPDASLADPHYSHGRFVVGGGDHVIYINAGPMAVFLGGWGWIRVDTMTKDMCKADGWKGLQPVFKNQGDCVSFVAAKATK